MDNIGVIIDIGSDFDDDNPMFEPIEGVDDRASMEDVVGITMSCDAL